LLDEAPEAYKIFHDESPKKYVIDPHNVTKFAAHTETARARPRVSAGCLAGTAHHW
jgi:glutathione-independent formaldehyde dehydrogenase